MLPTRLPYLSASTPSLNMYESLYNLEKEQNAENRDTIRRHEYQLGAMRYNAQVVKQRLTDIVTRQDAVIARLREENEIQRAVMSAKIDRLEQDAIYQRSMRADAEEIPLPDLDSLMEAAAHMACPAGLFFLDEDGVDPDATDDDLKPVLGLRLDPLEVMPPLPSDNMAGPVATKKKKHKVIPEQKKREQRSIQARCVVAISQLRTHNHHIIRKGAPY